jgi:hypothetical protein
MDFREHELDFREVDRRYAGLKRQLEAGTISDEEFDDQLKQLMVQDDQDRWWAKSRKTGEWHYRDGEAWVRSIPPGYQPATEGPPASSAPESRPEPGQVEPSSSDSQASGGVAGDGPRRRGALPWVLVAGLVAVVALVGVGAYLWGGAGMAVLPDVPSSGEEAPQPAPGYQLVENDSGNLSAEVPSEWGDLYTGYDGTFEGEDVDAGEGVGPAITASTDMNAWNAGDPVPGMYMLASRDLAREYDEDRLVDSSLNDLSSCDAGERQDFDRPPYSGKIQIWDCRGDGSTIFKLGAVPESRECAIVLQVKTYSEAEREAARHILDTFEADCERI